MAFRAFLQLWQRAMRKDRMPAVACGAVLRRRRRLSFGKTTSYPKKGPRYTLKNECISAQYFSLCINGGCVRTPSLSKGIQ